MSEESCTGCKIFSLCLGDPASLLDARIVDKCRYCGTYVMGKKQVYMTALCIRFRAYAHEYTHSCLIGTTVCSHSACASRACQSTSDNPFDA